jgi:amidase
VGTLADRPAADLRRMIAAREVSCAEVLDACLDRVTRLNETINAVVTLNARAMDDARELDRRLASADEPGPLCGLPVGIKDVTPVAGVRTTFGSPLYADYVPDHDALVVRRLRDAGAIILGKTNCPEFAAGGNTFNEVFGRTRNPWDTSKSAGGSTGGGAAALATGMIALAEGTDLGGSLRIPASFCGVVGLRPSVGLVPTHPTDWAWDTLQVSGPMARSAEDVALMLQAIIGPSEWSPAAAAPSQPDYVAAVQAGPHRGFRAGYCADPARIGIDPDIERVCRNAALGLATDGAKVDEIDPDLSSARPAFLALRGLWFVTHLSPHFEKAGFDDRGHGGRQPRFGPNVGSNVRAGLTTTTRELAAAEQERGRLWHRFRELFTRFDYILTPCMAVPPFPVEQSFPDAIAGKKMQNYVDWIAPTFVLSLTGLPVASVPCGVDAGGMPVGLQIVGRPQHEGAVLALAGAIQRRHPLGAPPLIEGERS